MARQDEQNYVDFLGRRGNITQDEQNYIDAFYRGEPQKSFGSKILGTATDALKLSGRVTAAMMTGGLTEIKGSPLNYKDSPIEEGIDMLTGQAETDNIGDTSPVVQKDAGQLATEEAKRKKQAQLEEEQRLLSEKPGRGGIITGEAPTLRFI